MVGKGPAWGLRWRVGKVVGLISRNHETVVISAHDRLFTNPGIVSRCSHNSPNPNINNEIDLEKHCTHHP